MNGSKVLVLTAVIAALMAGCLVGCMACDIEAEDGTYSETYDATVGAIDTGVDANTWAIPEAGASGATVTYKVTEAALGSDAEDVTAECGTQIATLFGTDFAVTEGESNISF